MSDFATLGMGIDSSGLVRGRDELGRLTDAGGRAEDRLTRNAGTISRVWARLGGVLAGAFSIREVSRAADRYTQMTNLLRSMGASAEGAARELQGIADVAKRTRAPLDAMASLYQRISIASDELGASQKDALRFTENIGLALAQQGGSAAAASGALLQLSQAMGAGTVRAEEFNSILEGAFPIAQAAARGIDAAGGSVARLRQLVVDGKVSSDEFFRAILSQTDQLEAAFANTVPTIAQAFGQLSDSFTMFIGQADSATGVSALLAQSIIAIADNLQLIVVVGATAATFFGVRLVGAFIASQAAAVSLTGALVALRTALIRIGIGALIVGAGYLIDRFLTLITATGSLGTALGLVGDVFKEVFDRMRLSIPLIGDIMAGLGMQIEGAFMSAFGVVDQAWRTLANGIIEGINSIASSLNSVFKTNFGMAELIPDSTLGAEGDNRSALGAELVGSASGELGRFLGSELESVNALKAAIDEANAALTGGGEGEGAAPTPAGTAMGAMGEAGGGGAGGGGLLGGMQRLNELLGQFQEQDPRAAIEAWHAEAMAALNDANLIERGMMEEHNAYKLAIEKAYSDQLVALKMQEAEMVRNAASGMYGALGSLMQQFAGKSKAAAIAAIAIQKGLSIAQIIANTAAAQMRALAELGPIAGPPVAAKIGVMGKVQAALVAATGLAQAMGSRPGASGGAASTPAASQSTERVQNTTTQQIRFEVVGEGAGADAAFRTLQLVQQAIDNGGRIDGLVAERVGV
ncbi:tape measure protein [Yoonia sp.]|uniref:tape measure protein n=1 Tax=Yoonia sp. TaxID=2212373 RepID=UPI002DFB943C|nr:tape measure protein [Yoonia sp.]